MRSSVDINTGYSGTACYTRIHLHVYVHGHMTYVYCPGLPPPEGDQKSKVQSFFNFQMLPSNLKTVKRSKANVKRSKSRSRSMGHLKEKKTPTAIDSYVCISKAGCVLTCAYVLCAQRAAATARSQSRSRCACFSPRLYLHIMRWRVIQRISSECVSRLCRLAR